MYSSEVATSNLSCESVSGEVGGGGGRTHQCEQVEEDVAVSPEDVEAVAAEVDEQLEARRRLVTPVDDVSHVRGQHEWGPVPVGGGGRGRQVREADVRVVNVTLLAKLGGINYGHFRQKSKLNDLNRHRSFHICEHNYEKLEI